MNSSLDVEMRTSVFQVLTELQESKTDKAILEKEIIQRDFYLAGNATALNDLLNLNSFLTPRGVIGKKYLFFVLLKTN
jgi:hypothetical protein